MVLTVAEPGRPEPKARPFRLALIVAGLLLAGAAGGFGLLRWWWTGAEGLRDRSEREQRSDAGERCPPPTVNGVIVRVEFGGAGVPDTCVYTARDGASFRMPVPEPG